MPDPETNRDLPGPTGAVLVAAIFVLAICGLVYELIAGTLSSYLLGDSVTQFSLVIGLFMTAMGVGSYVSKYFGGDLLSRLISVEIAVGLVGGLMGLACFAAFSFDYMYQPILFGFVVATGLLVGLEIPLVTRILRSASSLRITLANVLSADYAGALFASALFPFLLLPFLGVVRAGLVMGLLNVGVAAAVIGVFRHRLGKSSRGLLQQAVTAFAMLAGAFVFSGTMVSFLETRLYADEIVFAQTTPYQRIVVTRWRDNLRLFLNGHLQFASVDEYRYHEALVHPAMGWVRRRENVLILGGGDGLAAREVAKYPDVQTIDLVDIDPAVTELFATNPLLTEVNHHIFDDPRLTVHNQDAFAFLRTTREAYDVILLDLPDPSTPELSKLYSRPFYGLAAQHLRSGGLIAAQCTSPFRSREAFWCAVHTLASIPSGPARERGMQVRPYHTIVPTFGTWGFAVAGAQVPPAVEWEQRVDMRYLNRDVLAAALVFPPDMTEVETPVTSLDDPVIARLYRGGYHKYLE